MRVGVLIAGIVLLAVGYPFLWYGIGAVLMFIGILLVIIGAVVPARGSAARPGTDAYLRAITDRLYLVEVRQIQMEEHLKALGEKVGVIPPSVPSRQPAPLFPWAAPPPSAPPLGVPPPRPAPPPVAEAGAAAVPAPAGVPPPAPPIAAPTAVPSAVPPSGISRLEQQLGEKWFLWIGLLVLAIAFAFFLAIVLPQLTPQQIVAAVFASAAGLALLGEYIFSRKSLREYAKAFEAGAYGIAYIGVWGGGFFLRLPGFPWQVILAAVLSLHAAAVLRYRSPVLAVEVGLVYLAWIAWLRATGEIAASDLAILLSVGAVAVLGLAYMQRDARSVLALTIAFDVVAVGAFGLLIPYGFVPALAVALVTGIVLTFLRLGRLITLPAPFPLAFWVVGIVLAYGALIANSLPLLRHGGYDDVVIAGIFAAVTAAFTASEFLLRDRGNPPALAAVLAPLLFPLPFLLARGEFGLVVYPALLLVLAAVPKTRGLAWFTNVPYVGLLLFVAVGLPLPEFQFAAAWILFFGLAVLHGFLQIRSGYTGVPTGWPVDVPILFYAVGLVGLSARGIPGPWAIGMHAIALPIAILLNRGALMGSRGSMALGIAAVGVAAALARWWALIFQITGFGAANGPLLAGFHLAVFLALGGWVLHRKAVGSFPYGPTGTAVSFSWPALALLTGLLAQDWYEAHVFAALPPAVALIAYLLDDPITFNAGYVAMTGQTTAAAALFTARPGDALPLLLIFAAALIVLGFVFDLWTSRRILTLASQMTGGSLWFPVAPIVFGADVQTTISWTAVGAVAVGWGLWRRLPYLRYLGFALFFAVLGKVFLYDIAGLDLAVRVLALVIVAASLLAISYGYARYRKKHASAG